MLEAYAVTGVLGLARRDGNRRYYDVVERLLPADVLAHEIPLREQLRHKLLSRYRAHGLLGVGGAGDIFGGIGPAKPDPRWPGHPGRTALREELVATGELVPVEVENVRGKRFVLRAEVELLERPPEPPSSVAFLSPVRSAGVGPGPARIPVRASTTSGSSSSRRPSGAGAGTCCRSLFGDRLVGRIEPRIDRDGGRVQVLDLWWEDGFAPRRAEGFVDAMRDALRAYLRFGCATRIEWAPELTMEKRLFLTRP